MIPKSCDLIKEVRNVLGPKYEFPYYALVRVHSRRDGTFHLPATLFNGMSRRSKFAGRLKIARDMRDGEYFECPFCGEKSFYSGACQNCKMEMEEWNEETEEWDQVIDLEYHNREAMKKAAKEEFLRRLDTNTPDLGIISAEIVLPVPYGGEWDPSPFLKSEEWRARRALNRIERILSIYDTLKKSEEYQKMVRVFLPDDGLQLPLDYLEGDVIEVDGSSELRRYNNDVWQHKHPVDGYDYWHPIARIHKEVCNEK